MSRVEKVAQAIKREISNIIHDELKDPRIGFVTITGVDLTKDLRIAKIYYSVLGDVNEKDKTSAALKNAKGFMRRLLGQRLELRYAPEINFKEDRSIEYSLHIERELDKLKECHESKKSNRRDKQK